MTIRGTIRNSILAILLLLICSGCAKPVGSSHYIARDPAASPDVHKYIIQFEMDSSVVYSTSVFCSFDREKVVGDNMDMDITLVSPNGLKYGETVEFPLVESDRIKLSRRGGTLMDIEWPYRDNITADCSGVWSIIFNLTDSLQSKGVIGMGFSCNGER